MPGSAASISLMGPFALRIGARRQRLRLAGNTKRLFMLLAGNFNRGLRRESVIEEIWPGSDPTRGASSLNTGLWKVKNCLAGYPGLAVQSIDDIVRLNVCEPAAVDVDQLERAVRAVPAKRPSDPLDSGLHSRLVEAVAMCRGKFLDGCDDHWVLPIRERYAAFYIQALTILMRDVAALSQFELALIYGREILELDPFREGTQREVMWLYVLNGQRAQAILKYRSLKALLKVELDIAPMPETTALFVKIANAEHCLSGLEGVVTEDWSEPADMLRGPV